MRFKTYIQNYTFVFLSVFFQSISFIFSKLVALNVVYENIYEYIFNVFYISSLACLVFQAYFWQKALRYLELSKAYPYTGIMYFLIILYSYVFFEEQIYINNIIGVLIIFLGIFVISLEGKEK